MQYGANQLSKRQKKTHLFWYFLIFFLVYFFSFSHFLSCGPTALPSVTLILHTLSMYLTLISVAKMRHYFLFYSVQSDLHNVQPAVQCRCRLDSTEWDVGLWTLQIILFTHTYFFYIFYFSTFLHLPPTMRLAIPCHAGQLLAILESRFAQ